VSSGVTGGLAASVHARLLNRAKARGEDFNLILTRYALERFLFRNAVRPVVRCTASTHA
jgi:hypothetical protein